MFLVFLCRPVTSLPLTKDLSNNFYAVMAAKRFRTRTEEEIEKFLRYKSSKSTNEVLTFVI